MKTGERIKALRIEQGITQEALAEKTEVSARTIQRIENGEVIPRAYTLQMIAKALEVDYSTLSPTPGNDSQAQQSPNNNVWLGLIHLSGIIPFILPTFLLWQRKKGSVQNITEHYRTAISFQLIVLGVVLGGFWAYYWTGMLTPLMGTLLLGALISIVNAIKATNGDNSLKFPFEKKHKD
jgi:transcriptional regulator with XRE-family HTH domain